MKSLPQIVKGERHKRYIELELVGGDRPQLIDVRGGLAFPTSEYPAYAVIVGMEWVDPKLYYVKESALKLHVLAELVYESFGLERLFDKLSDLAKLCCCDSFYCNLDEKDDDFLNAAIAYRDKHKSHYGDLVQAPFVENPWLGVSLISDWAKSGKLEIPEDSQAYEQLKKLSRTDLEDLDAFYSIQALRYVAGAYYKDPPREVRPYRYQLPRSETGPLGWMAG